MSFLVLILTLTSSISQKDILLKEAMEVYTRGNLKLAIEKLEAVHKLDPEDKEVKKLLSEALTKLGKKYCLREEYKRARMAFYRAWKLDPSNVVAKGYYNLTSTKIKGSMGASSDVKKFNLSISFFIILGGIILFLVFIFLLWWRFKDFTSPFP